MIEIQQLGEVLLLVDIILMPIDSTLHLPMEEEEDQKVVLKMLKEFVVQELIKMALNILWLLLMFILLFQQELFLLFLIILKLQDVR